MAEEFTKSIKNISGITSHYGFKSTSASGVHFTLGAETVIIHSTCSELFVMIKDTCVKVHRGEFLLIDPFTPYSVIYNPEAEEQTYEQLSFRATTDQWNKTSCFFFAKGIFKLGPQDPEYADFCLAYANVIEVISRFPKDNSRPPFTELLKLHGLTEMLAAMMISDLGWHEIPSPGFEAWDTYEPAVSFVTENLGSDISLDDISVRSGLSTFYFSHKYKEIFGNTVMRDVNRLKLYKSVAMLIQSTDSISEIASACGFSSVATYCSVFKKFYTFSPLAMRRKKTILRNVQYQGQTGVYHPVRPETDQISL